MSGVLYRIAADQVMRFRLGQSGIARRDPEGRDLAAVEHCNMADIGGRQLVEAIGAVHDPGPLDSQQTEHAGDRLDPLLAEYADDLIFGARRIGERAEQIEDRADAKLASHFCDVAHGGVMGWCEHEAETTSLDAAGNGLR